MCSFLRSPSTQSDPTLSEQGNVDQEYHVTQIVQIFISQIKLRLSPPAPQALNVIQRDPRKKEEKKRKEKKGCFGQRSCPRSNNSLPSTMSALVRRNFRQNGRALLIHHMFVCIFSAFNWSVCVPRGRGEEVGSVHGSAVPWVVGRGGGVKGEEGGAGGGGTGWGVGVGGLTSVTKPRSVHAHRETRAAGTWRSCRPPSF